MKIIPDLRPLVVNMFYLCVLLYTFGSFHLKTLWREWQMGKKQFAPNQKNLLCSIHSERYKRFSIDHRPRANRPHKREQFLMQGKKVFFQFEGKIVEILEPIIEEGLEEDETLSHPIQKGR